MTTYICYRCKKEIPDGQVIRLSVSVPVHYDPTCWSAAVDEIVEEMLSNAARTRADVGRPAPLPKDWNGVHDGPL